MKSKYINIVLFILTIFIIGLLNLFNQDRPRISEIENRMLKAVPDFSMKALLDGSLFKDYEEYFADTFVFRDSLVGINSDLKALRGYEPDNGARIIQDRGNNVAEERVNPEDAVGENSDMSANGNNSINNEISMAAAKKNMKSDGESKNTMKGDLVRGMLVLYDTAMEIYHFNKAPSQYYANALNSFKEKLPENINVYSMIIPTRFEFIKDEKYKKLGSSQREAVDYISSYLDKSIKVVDIIDILSAHSSEYIYFRSDHHWTTLGAYYAYTRFIEMAGMKPAGLDEFTSGEVENFLGSTYSSTLAKKVRKNPDTIIYYLPTVEYTYSYYTDKAVESSLINLDKVKSDNKYRIFLGGDRAFGKIFTGNKNGRKIMVVKDSFGNTFIPFLVQNYEEIYIVDPRMFGSNPIKLAKKWQVQDILLMNYTISTATNGYSDLILNLIGD